MFEEMLAQVSMHCSCVYSTILLFSKDKQLWHAYDDFHSLNHIILDTMFDDLLINRAPPLLERISVELYAI